jgi:hypothetical protein
MSHFYHGYTYYFIDMVGTKTTNRVKKMLSIVLTL